MPFLTNIALDERLRMALASLEVTVKLQIIGDALIQSIAASADQTAMSSALATEIARRKTLDIHTRNTGG